MPSDLIGAAGPCGCGAQRVEVACQDAERFRDTSRYFLCITCDSPPVERSSWWARMTGKTGKTT